MARVHTSRTHASRVLSILAVLVLLVAFIVPVAADEGDKRFELDVIEELVPQVAPIALDPTQKTVVMIKLSGEPVALVQARKPGKQISDGERDSVKRQLRGTQDSLVPQIQALGGRILGQYQSAYNGIKVEIARRSVSALQALPDVVLVVPVPNVERDNATSVPYIGAPSVWEGRKGLRGERIKIGIIDTGIDYTHANFGGPGTAAAFAAASATSTAPADKALFGKSAPKVKGGIDLVGDDYSAGSSDPALNTPRPDPNPLDCNGHGSHVAGTAAGFGVNAAGTTYRGPYDTSLPFSTFRVGPGVAPLADLYAIRVFGCAGSTNVTVDAIDWAVDNEMDVINMSLGSSFGGATDPSAEASNNAARAGVVVVASAGNNGPAPYITGSPATATRALSVAANDSTSSFPGATLTLSGGTALGTTTLTSINANGATFANGLTLPVKVLFTGSQVSLGCSPADYVGVAGTLVVTRRGTCARVARAVYGQQAGAAAVLMINNTNSLPPFEGPITSNPDTGQQYNVTIPFLGVRSSDSAALVARNNGSVTLTNTTLANPGFSAIASFSSGGPRSGDSILKPDVSAPGVSTLSTDIGTGNRGTRLSGTSMAAPHAAGLAALVLQAQERMDADDDEDGNGIAERVKAAIVNTASPSAIAGYATRNAGSGLIQAVAATRTRAVVTGDPGTASLSFGFAELGANYSSTKTIRVRGFGDGNSRFTIAAVLPQGAPHTISLSRSSVAIEDDGSAKVKVTLSVPAATTGSASAFREVAGIIELTPVGGGNNGVTLRVPYYLVPRGLSNVAATVAAPFGPTAPAGSATLTNAGGALAGSADFYAWGINDLSEAKGETDLRAAGVQSFACASVFGAFCQTGERFMVFAVNTWQRWSNAAVNEYDVLVDVDRDGIDDFVVVAADQGLVEAGSRNGQLRTYVFNLRTGAGSAIFAGAIRTDNSTVLLPVLSRQFAAHAASGTPGLTAASPRFNYTVDIFAGRDGIDDLGSARGSFNAFTSAISTGQFAAVAPGATVSVPVSVNAAEWAQTPALGLMVVVLDNAAGAAEARLITVPIP